MGHGAAGSAGDWAAPRPVGSVRGVSIGVASWNLFHGRAVPVARRNLFADVAAALAAADWDVCGLQELPPWWAVPLAEACGASLRVSRTSYARSVLPALQERVSAPDPERLGARGAAVNALLVRPGAGWIVEHRRATLRRFPQRRTVHAVRLARPGGSGVWVANVHTHNRPPAAADHDLHLACAALRGWSTRPADAVLLGDLNLPREPAEAVAAAHGFTWLAGDRVDHVVGSAGVALLGAASAATAAQPRTLDGAAALSDHRLLTARLRLCTR